MMMNVEGYVPKEAIIDTGAAKAMCSAKFAAAIGVDMRQLQRGEAFVTASGAIERPLGVTNSIWGGVLTTPVWWIWR